MNRLIGLLLMLTAIYVGMTLYTEGLDHAFGGIFLIPAPDPTEWHSDGDDPQSPL